MHNICDIALNSAQEYCSNQYASCKKRETSETIQIKNYEHRSVMTQRRAFFSDFFSCLGVFDQAFDLPLPLLNIRFPQNNRALFQVFTDFFKNFPFFRLFSRFSKLPAFSTVFQISRNFPRFFKILTLFKGFFQIFPPFSKLYRFFYRFFQIFNSFYFLEFLNGFFKFSRFFSNFSLVYC